VVEGCPAERQRKTITSIQVVGLGPQRWRVSIPKESYVSDLVVTAKQELSAHEIIEAAEGEVFQANTIIDLAESIQYLV
jgi:hypothetical protein